MVDDIQDRLNEMLEKKKAELSDMKNMLGVNYDDLNEEQKKEMDKITAQIDMTELNKVVKESTDRIFNHITSIYKK